PGTPKSQTQLIALGLEPDSCQLFSSVLQGSPLFRGRLYKKIHSAPPWSNLHFHMVMPTQKGKKQTHAGFGLHGAEFDSCRRGAMVQQTSPGVMRMAPLALTDSHSPAADPALQPPAKPMTSPPAPRASGAVLWGLMLIALPVLVSQIALTRVMSVLVNYPSAFLILSVVMLGMAASAVAVFLGMRRPDRPITIADAAGAAYNSAACTALAVVC